VAAEAAFLSAYAVALVVVATGLDALGRRARDPWGSAVLAGSRPAEGDPAPEPAPAWPADDVAAFHAGLAAVALVAALALTAVNAARHHGAVELAVDLAVTALIARRGAALARNRRAAAVPEAGAGRDG
jgi:hypothetical protein